ncbi:hypothetical protein EDO6_02320 [Paenibacillus xylanexedens]|nr:hypothetical protein EDO6_02320 [Paenibacillus xylanexedens]
MCFTIYSCLYYNDTNINHNKPEGKHPEVNKTGYPVCSTSVKLSLFCCVLKEELV